MAADEEDVLPGMCKPDTCRLCLTCGRSDCTLHCFDAGVLCSAYTCLMSNMVTDFFLQFKVFGCINTLAELDEQRDDWEQDSKGTVFRENRQTIKTQ